MSQGVLYVGVDRPYFDQALDSLESLRESNDVSASIVTSPELADADGADQFDTIVTVEDSFHDVRDKVYNLSKSPYDETIFLDGDTYVVGDISPVFELLDRVDIAAVMSPARYTVEIPNIPNSFPKMNTGVVGYTSSEAVDKMLSLWQEFLVKQMETGRPKEGESIAHPKYDSLENLASFGNVYDEVPFREAVYESDVQWSFLPPEYNFGKSGRGYTRRKAKILHSKHRDKLRGVINDTETPRVVVGDKLYYLHQHHSPSVRLAGIPIFEPILHYLDVPSVMRRLGIYEPTRRVYRKVTDLYNAKGSE